MFHFSLWGEEADTGGPALSQQGPRASQARLATKAMPLVLVGLPIRGDFRSDRAGIGRGIIFSPKTQKLTQGALDRKNRPERRYLSWN